MPLDKAESVLRKMSKKLDGGLQWKDAYRFFSDMHPDLRDRAKNPKSIRTLICYLYDSTVSPTAFNHRITEELMKIIYRKGKKEDSLRIAELDNIASDGAIEFLFHDLIANMTPVQIVVSNLESDRYPHSYRSVIV